MNVWKYRLMNTVAESFNTTVRQMTEMSKRKKTAANISVASVSYFTLALLVTLHSSKQMFE